MIFTGAEKKDWGERVEGHLLDQIDFIEENDKWIWVIDECVHAYDFCQPDPVRYKSREACVNACLYQMRNSRKLDYAKGMATEGIKYVRGLNA